MTQEQLQQAAELARTRRTMRWVLTVGLWGSYAAMVTVALLTKSLEAWGAESGWATYPALMFFGVFPFAVALLTWEVWRGPLRPGRQSLLDIAFEDGRKDAESARRQS
ncbi:hypothetical protein [Ottowia sp.]|uniref:hypothetical protein n=1 Tax=Ottowia sp. TaxID=1898956 RepID=UPI0025DCED2C|nr:hypothetical protein [Ottowia sp.]MBK6616219.1 hypothetical protein [Ottowia sp.]